MTKVVATIVPPLPVTIIAVVIVRICYFFAVILPLPVTLIAIFIVRMNEVVTVVLPRPLTITSVIVIKVRGGLTHAVLFSLSPISNGTFFFPYR